MCVLAGYTSNLSQFDTDTSVTFSINPGTTDVLCKTILLTILQSQCLTIPFVFSTHFIYFN